MQKYNVNTVQCKCSSTVSMLCVQTQYKEVQIQCKHSAKTNVSYCRSNAMQKQCSKSIFQCKNGARAVQMQCSWKWICGNILHRVASNPCATCTTAPVIILIMVFNITSISISICILCICVHLLEYPIPPPRVTKSPDGWNLRNEKSYWSSASIKTTEISRAFQIFGFLDFWICFGFLAISFERKELPETCLCQNNQNF